MPRDEWKAPVVARIASRELGMLNLPADELGKSVCGEDGQVITILVQVLAERRAGESHEVLIVTDAGSRLWVSATLVKETKGGQK